MRSAMEGKDGEGRSCRFQVLQSIEERANDEMHSNKSKEQSNNGIFSEVRDRRRRRTRKESQLSHKREGRTALIPKPSGEKEETESMESIMKNIIGSILTTLK